MKTILSSKRDPYLAKFIIFLITVAVIAGMVGCVDHPFGEDLEIETWYDLDAVRNNLDNHHTLVNDLDSTTDGYEELASAAAHGRKGWEPIGTWSARFTGSFDGRGHKIMDLFIDRPSEENVGLFSFVAEGGVIKNVRVVDVAVTGRDSVGGLVGENSGTVSNSYSSGSVTGDDGVGCLVGWNKGNVSDDSHSTSNVTGDDGVGCLVGWNTGTVSNSYSTGSVTGDEDVGGLVGWNTGTVSNNSYSSGSVTGDEDVGGLVGWNEKGTVSNSHSTGSVTGESYVGGLVGGNEKGTVSNSHSTGSVTGESYIGGLVGYNYEESTVSNSHSTGSVTGESYIGGLVGYNWEGTVRDSYSTGSVSGDEDVGGLVGFSYRSTVSNSHYSYDEVLINGQNVITTGVLFGEDFDQWLNNDKFLDVNERLSKEDGYYVVNNVTDFKELIAFGQNGSLKFRLKTDLDLATEPNLYIPYFAGEFDGNGHKISNLSSNFDFVCNVGLFGYLDGRVTQVGVESVKITGASFVGGLVGYNWEGTVRDSYSTGSVTSYGSYGSGLEDLIVSGAGGLVGSNDAGTVENCNSTGSVTGNWHVGGLVGWNYKEGTVSHSYSTGSVTGNRRVGGLVGWNEGKVESSYSSCIVTGGDAVGGLVGRNEDFVSKSFSTGSVSGEDVVGGLVGWNEDIVSNSYSTGNVYGDDWIGGLVGFNDVKGIVNRTYSRGTVTGDDYVGGLVGRNDNDVSRSFWDTETSRQDTSDGGTGKTTAEMKSINTFTDLDICTVNLPSKRNTDYTWNIVNGQTYPFLSWEP